MADAPKQDRCRRDPVTAKDHLKYWIGVGLYYLRGLLLAVVVPLMIVVIFGTGAYLQEFANTTGRDVCVIWLLLAICVAGLACLPKDIES